MKELRVLHIGLGAIGLEVAKLVSKKSGLRTVGASDLVKYVGEDFGEVLGVGKTGVKVSSDYRRVLKEVKPDLVLHATSSYLQDVYEQIVDCVKAGANVISTCEELSYPYRKHPSLAKNLDHLAKEYRVRVLGTGVNPGFLMDTLVLLLTAVCQEVYSIVVERVIDASHRREAFQRKIGAALTEAEFKGKMAAKEISGHVGLEESIALIGDAMGWVVERIEAEQPEPIIASKEVSSPYYTISAGRVAGLQQTARGFVDGKERITLVFKAYVGAEDEYDRIHILGNPEVHQTIKPAIQGDRATAAVVVNSIWPLMKCRPGLRTMKDLQTLSFR
ncbi:MAG: hypothetical protein QXN08_08525 [Nitrososphaerales archaeon]